MMTSTVGGFSESLFSVSQDEGMQMQQLDSTKRCLFPEDDESFSGGGRLWGNGFFNNADNDNDNDDDDESDQNITEENDPAEEEEEEEMLTSPISVVSVWSIGQPNLNSNTQKLFDSINHTASSSRNNNNKEIRILDKTNCLRNNNADGVEEQTVIEVQYVEAVNSRDHDTNDVEHTSCTGSPDRKDNNTQAALHDLTNTTRNFSDVRSKPLLDIEKTPLRSPRQNNKMGTPSFVCGGSDTYLPTCNACDDSESEHHYVEKTITSFLEDTSVSTPESSFKTCSDWQAWSYFGFGKPGTESCDTRSRSVKQTPSKENIRSILRRRTSHSLRVRKSNVRQLKQNLAPFGHSPARSPARALFRNRSFSVSDHRSAIVRVSKDREQQSRKSFTDVLQLCTMFENTALDSPDLVRKISSSNYYVTDDDFSYDSDPEDFARRRPILGSAKSSVVAVDESSILDESYNYRSFPVSSPSPNRVFFNPRNDEVFSSIVQEIFNQTTTLVLHPHMELNNTNTASSGTVLHQFARRPVAVDAWLERGQHLAYNLIQPKWIWKAKQPRQDLGLGLGLSSVRQKNCLHGIELLDITRILKLEDTEGYHNQSFAKPSHCFFIKSIHDEEFCFEAKSKKERDRLVSSLKLLIARFGAYVLTGDQKVYYEFFWMSEAAPGHAPDFNPEIFTAGKCDS
jgi:hypothetical protein